MTISKTFMAGLVVTVAMILGIFRMIPSETAQQLLEKDKYKIRPSIDTVPSGVGNLVSTAANRVESSFPVKGFAMMTPDSSTSVHPVEHAVANGLVLDQVMEATQDENQWRRVRLVKSKIQHRLVRVVELWQFDWLAAQAVCLKRDMFLADQIIVKAAEGIPENNLRQHLLSEGMSITCAVTNGMFTVRLAKNDLESIPEALRFFSKHPELAEFVEPDGVGFGGGTPNDPRFAEQWGLDNIGQSSGVIDADVDGLEFWDVVGGAPGVVVAVLDSGLNYTHPDLQNIGWVNPGEVSGDGVDNDANGKIDDFKGWDFVNNDNDPTDDHGHGSNVTGIMAANRNNGVGCAGLLNDVKILVCKILNSQNSGFTSDLIAATAYARERGVPVMNLSLQNYPYSGILNSEFAACASAGIVMVICSGNQGVDNDLFPNYPSSYTQTNIIVVGGHDRTDMRWSGSYNPSNYGVTSVDLFAPGRDILAPILGNSYSSYTGTSQATPFVTAVCCAIKYINPGWSAAQIKESILRSVVAKSSYGGICVTGGRLNGLSAISYAIREIPSQDTDGDGFSNLFEYLGGTRVDVPSNRPAMTSDLSGGLLRVAMSRVLRADAHLVVETSADLVTWTTMGVTTARTAENLSGSIPVSGGTRGFLRIRANPYPD